MGYVSQSALTAARELFFFTTEVTGSGAGVHGGGAAALEPHLSTAIVNAAVSAVWTSGPEIKIDLRVET